MDNGGEVLDFSNMPAHRRSTLADRVPHYELYGDAKQSSALEPLHIETLEARSLAHGWTIQPHQHSDLYQIMWLSRGSGLMLIEHETRHIHAPRLIAVPPGVVHGFQWDMPVDGFILMASRSFMARTPFADAPLTRLIDTTLDDGGELLQAFAGLHNAFQSSTPGRLGAMTGYAFVILAILTQSLETAAAPVASGPSATDLVLRLRAVLEERFRDHPSVYDLAAQLNVTPSRLTRACVAVTGAAPQALLHNRIMLEARRLLTYTTLPVAEVGYNIGFADAAYFSRFFRQREGRSPQKWRG